MPDDVDETAHPVIPAEVAAPDVSTMTNPAPADGGWANLQRELAQTRDAYVSLKQTLDALVIEHNAALDQLGALKAQQPT